MRAHGRLLILIGIVLSVVLSMAGAALAAPVAQEIVPDRASAGARVLIAGQELDASGITVRFGSANATVLVRTSTSLEVRVPATTASTVDVLYSVDVLRSGAVIRTFAFTITPALAFDRVDTLPAPAGTLLLPIGIGTVPNGDVYVADTAHDRIKRFRNGQWSVVTVASEPAGVVVDANGVIYFVETGLHRIRRMAGTTVTTLAGGSSGDRDGTGSTARFNRPSGLALDSSGNLYVADTLNHKIRKVTQAGVVTTVAGTATRGYTDGAALTARFSAPTGLAFGPEGTLFIADSENHRIRSLSGATVATVAGSGQAGFVEGAAAQARFSVPTGVAVDETGGLFVADTLNRRVRRIAGGVVSTAAGNGGFGTTDGSVGTATFLGPTGIDAAGHLLVTDTPNSSVRVITSSPRLQAIHPRSGPAAGGTVVRLFGSGFTPSTTVKFGTQNAAVTFVEGTMLRATVPAGSGAMEVRVTNAAGTIALPSAYNYTGAPPTIASVAPVVGPSSGGTTGPSPVRTLAEHRA